MTYAIGVDLGTSYSAAAVARSGGRVDIFQLGTGMATMPSVVLLRADGETLVGDAAERRSFQEPTRTAREFKRRFGDSVPLILGGTPYNPATLLTILLRSIVSRVREQEGAAPTAVVVTHPAGYGPYKLDLLREAAREADVGDVTFLPEPHAAALHYASQERVAPGTLLAVYDFGGGTFDATVLRKTAQGFEMLGVPEGLERLGGADFDEAVFAHVADVLGARLRALDPSNPSSLATLARVRDESRRAKEALSADTDAVVPVFLADGSAEVRITRPEFEAMIRPRIRETIASLDRAVRSADLTFSDLDRILLVGGTSRIPLVAEMVREATGRPLSLDAHPKHVVALGAALTALPAASAEPVPDVSAAPAVEPAVAPSLPAAPARPGPQLPPRVEIADQPVVEPEPRVRPEPARLMRPARPPLGMIAAAVLVAILVALIGGIAASGMLSPRATVAPSMRPVPTLPPVPTPIVRPS